MRVRLPPSAPFAKWYKQHVGAWLSLVERRVRVAEVGGSNPLAPTITTRREATSLPFAYLARRFGFKSQPPCYIGRAAPTTHRMAARYSV